MSARRVVPTCCGTCRWFSPKAGSMGACTDPLLGGANVYAEWGELAVCYKAGTDKRPEVHAAKVRAAEQAIIRAARRWRDKETDDDRNAAVKLCRALDRLDRVTRGSK